MASQQRSLKISGSLSRRSSKSCLGTYGAPLLLVLIAVVTITVYLCLLQMAAAPIGRHQSQQHELPHKVTYLRESPVQTKNDGLTTPLLDERNKAQHVPPSQPQQHAVMDPSTKKKKKETLILTIADLGVVQIVLRPDLSQESVDYVRAAAQQPSCQRCNLYRAEKPGILQGVLKVNNRHVPPVTVKGSCPAGYENVKNDCPSWDTQCACHGPVMERGMVAWAAGGTGPDFFIDVYKRKAEWWGTQHTVWGEIQDKESFKVISEHIFLLPMHSQGGLTMLNKPLHYDMLLE